MDYGWIAFIVAAAGIIVLFTTWRSRRYWPGAVGWAIDMVSVAFMITDGFGDYSAIGVAGLIVGTTLAFTGFLISQNSPVT